MFIGQSVYLVGVAGLLVPWLFVPWLLGLIIDFDCRGWLNCFQSKFPVLMLSASVLRGCSGLRFAAFVLCCVQRAG